VIAQALNRRHVAFRYCVDRHLDAVFACVLRGEAAAHIAAYWEQRAERVRNG